MNHFRIILTLITSMLFGGSALAVLPLTTQIIKNNVLEPGLIVVSAAGTTTLTATSNPNVYVTGSTTQNVVMPDGRLIYAGNQYFIGNESSGAVTVKNGAGSNLVVLPAGSSVKLRLKLGTSQAGSWSVAAIDAFSGSSGGSPFVRKAGDTMTGGLVINTSGSELALEGVSGQLHDIRFRNGGVLRWVVRMDGTAESGSNAGSDFSINARADDGSGLDQVFLIPRANGSRTITPRPIGFNSNVPDSVATLGGVSVALNVKMGGGLIISEGANKRQNVVALSGVSTLIANTSVTALTRVYLTGVGASNVAPWLIGVSSGVGYSVGATGAGSAQSLLVEGQ